jgi:glucose/arabinose dehydrogenase
MNVLYSWLSALSFVLITGLSTNESIAQTAINILSNTPTNQVVGPTIKPAVLASGLEHPWALAFIGNGNMLVTERPGRMRVISQTGEMSAPLRGLPKIQVQGQGGLLDVIVDRNFETNQTIYFCYTEPDLLDSSSNRNSTALARAELSADRTKLLNVKVIFQQAPKFASGFHFGCRIVQAPDNTLYLGSGDRFSLMQQAQSLENHIGKVIRINPDGSVPADNPFIKVAGAKPEIWSYGHRNIQGALLASDGTLWMHEHGPQGGDELNIIKPGANYGWPVITYGENYGGGKIGAGITEQAGMAQPIKYWTPSIAPSGLALLTNNLYGHAWQDSLIIGSLKFRYLVRVPLKNGQAGDPEIILPELGQRVRDVRIGPDGLIYLLTDQSDGELIRLDP